MALTITPVANGGKAGESTAHLLFRFVDVTFDSSLAAGGESLTAASLGMSSILAVIEAGAAVPIGFVFKWDNDGEKLTAFQVPSEAAVTLAATVLVEAATVDVATIAGVVRFLVIGIAA